LKWATRGMRSVSLDSAPTINTRDNWEHQSHLPPEGSLVVTPAVDTVYVLSCESDSGSSCASASVKVELAK
jgi:hypothetical protein